ncbi:MAG: hypothetical protein KJS68_12340 [Alphaproteobacteria bacterium]|nr:hypothetical protein [Alphaproteobacteria bacterium]MDE2493837.1 hypothetical protein [Alphaproteobacteria bacterium]
MAVPAVSVVEEAKAGIVAYRKLAVTHAEIQRFTITGTPEEGLMNLHKIMMLAQQAASAKKA